MRTARAQLGPTPRKSAGAPSSRMIRKTPSKLAGWQKGEYEDAAKGSDEDPDAPVLVPEALLSGPPGVGGHADEDDVGRVPRETAESTGDARRGGHLPCRQGLADRMPLLESLLELVVDAKAGDRVRHLPEDGRRQAGVGASPDACRGEVAVRSS